MAFDCVLKAWHNHQAELRYFLFAQLKEPETADDVLQEIFLKAMKEGQSFCELDNSRSWLFRVARNALSDRHRLKKYWVPVPEGLPDHRREPTDPVAELDVCIRSALPSLKAQDREVIAACDLGSQTQEEFATEKSISLPAAKARIRRARERLRSELIHRCNVVVDDTGKICCHREASPDGGRFA